MTEIDTKCRFTCPLQRLFAPLRKRLGDAPPSWDELEMRIERGPSSIELRLLQGPSETGRLRARLPARSPEIDVFEGPSGPSWCRELLLEAAQEWARERTSNGWEGGT